MRVVASTFGDLYREVQDILYKWDPCHLAALGLPTDEYEPEARKILLRLRETPSVGAAVALTAEVFHQMFGDDTKCVHLDDAAREIWRATR
jgi:hypothetical protein